MEPTRVDRIIYDKTAGALYFDKDGIGRHHARLFANLDGSPDEITAKDFLIVEARRGAALRRALAWRV